ncbi:hypothetical protein RND81_07G122500 [Saponaria officinalis]|uniref:F-box domain-containing protein n=1 Tax=Saponaria officinalis TaxID=3572 RepID=A0AAW1JMP7_SAPOF
MSTIFPPEIEAEILIRLPAKSLQRFKTVCKSWCSLINSDYIFMTSFHRNSAKNPKLLFLKHPRETLTPIHFSVASTRVKSVVETTTLHLPSNVVSPDLGIIDHDLKPTRIELINSNSINGVLGIIVYMGFSNGPIDVRCDMYIWNPATCESVRVPKSDFTGLFNGPPMVKFYSGFGYDKSNVDYKVVRVVYMNSVRTMCEVYSIRRNCWKILNSGSGISSNTLWASEMCTYVDGIGYWGVYKRESKDKFFVLGFNFGEESFKKIKVPELCVDGREKKYHSLWEFRGVLALSVLHFGGFESSLTRLYIWVFRQCGEIEGFGQCWSTMFNIDLECGPRRPVVSLRSGELVLLGEDDGEHILYDPLSGQVEKLSICDVDHAVLHVDSLVSPSTLLPKEARSSLT